MRPSCASATVSLRGSRRLPQPNNISMAPAARTPLPPRFAARTSAINSQQNAANAASARVTRSAVSTGLTGAGSVQQRGEPAAPAIDAGIVGRQQGEGLQQVFTAGTR